MTYFKRKIKAILGTVKSRPRQPVKGDLLRMDLGDGSKLYRVIKTMDTDPQYLLSSNTMYVMSMEDLNYDNQYYWSTYSSATCDARFSDLIDGTKYAGSTLDTYLNQTYYNTLTTAIANGAIRDHTVVQDRYLASDDIWPDEVQSPKYKYKYGTNEKYLIGDFGTLSVGTRHIRALSLTDIIEYFAPEEGTSPSEIVLTDTNMKEFLYNNGQELGISTPYVMTNSVGRSGTPADYYYIAVRDVFYINSYMFSTSVCDNKYHKAARAVFVINLLNIEYSIV